MDRLPEGYEVYESPENAQVFLRKVKPTSILPLEKQLAEAAARRLVPGRPCIVEADGDALVIWLADNEGERMLEAIGDMFPFTQAQSRKFLSSMLRTARYTKMLRFTLVGGEGADRRFAVQRWCFRGSIDDWFFLQVGRTLADYLEKYLPHLGRESFYDLM